jgi:hypothetical protein
MSTCEDQLVTVCSMIVVGKSNIFFFFSLRVVLQSSTMKFGFFIKAGMSWVLLEFSLQSYILEKEKMIFMSHRLVVKITFWCHTILFNKIPLLVGQCDGSTKTLFEGVY